MGEKCSKYTIAKVTKTETNKPTLVAMGKC